MRFRSPGEGAHGRSSQAPDRRAGSGVVAGAGARVCRGRARGYPRRRARPRICRRRMNLHGSTRSDGWRFRYDDRIVSWGCSMNTVSSSPRRSPQTARNFTPARRSSCQQSPRNLTTPSGADSGRNPPVEAGNLRNRGRGSIPVRSRHPNDACDCSGLTVREPYVDLTGVRLRTSADDRTIAARLNCGALDQSTQGQWAARARTSVATPRRRIALSVTEASVPLPST